MLSTVSTVSSDPSWYMLQDAASLSGPFQLQWFSLGFIKHIFLVIIGLHPFFWTALIYYFMLIFIRDDKINTLFTFFT